jgi:hypothetical protein
MRDISQPRTAYPQVITNATDETGAGSSTVYDSRREQSPILLWDSTLNTNAESPNS